MLKGSGYTNPGLEKAAEFQKAKDIAKDQREATQRAHSRYFDQGTETKSSGGKGKGRGNWGHKGRKGVRGGSA
jgi:hypothetical protein